MAAQPTLEQVKDRMQATWSSGDYGTIAWITAPLGDALCEAVDLRPGCADHKQAARELVRVCRPGGTIGLLSWTPTGFVGEMLRAVAR